VSTLLDIESFVYAISYLAFLLPELFDRKYKPHYLHLSGSYQGSDLKDGGTIKDPIKNSSKIEREIAEKSE